MGSLTHCLKQAGDLLSADDRSFIVARAASLRKEGLSAADAATKAVDERLAEVQGQLDLFKDGGGDNVQMLPVSESDFASALRESMDRQGGDIEESDDGEFTAADQARGEDERYAATFNPAIKKVVLPRVTKTNPKPKGVEWIIPEEAARRLQSWKDEADRQGRVLGSENSRRTVISLFDTTGVISQPWVDAGYNVVSYDLKDGVDINTFDAENLLETHGNDEVYAILAQPPCTHFTSSGSQHWKAKDADGRTAQGIQLVRQALRTVELFRPPVWVLENPVGRIAEMTGLPEPLLTFDPWSFGDPYTKRTQLWGKFDNDLPQAPVEPVEGSKMHKMSSRRQDERSITPEGFAYAFFMANNAEGKPLAKQLANEFAGIDAKAFDAALLAGHTELQIRNEIEDSYYDNDLDYVREKLAEMAKPEVKNGPGVAFEQDGKWFVRFGDDRAAHGPMKSRIEAEAYAKALGPKEQAAPKTQADWEREAEQRRQEMQAQLDAGKPIKDYKDEYADVSDSREPMQQIKVPDGDWPSLHHWNYSSRDLAELQARVQKEREHEAKVRERIGPKPKKAEVGELKRAADELKEMEDALAWAEAGGAKRYALDPRQTDADRRAPIDFMSNDAGKAGLVRRYIVPTPQGNVQVDIDASHMVYDKDHRGMQWVDVELHGASVSETGFKSLGSSGIEFADVAKDPYAFAQKMVAEQQAEMAREEAKRKPQAPDQAAAKVKAKKAENSAPAEVALSPNYKAGDRIFPSKDVFEGDVLRLPDGELVMAKVKRGVTVPVFPIGNGKPVVNADSLRRIDLNEVDVRHTGMNVYGYGGQPLFGQDATVGKQPAERLTDAGEELIRNRRGKLKGLAWEDVSAMNDTLKVAQVVKTNVWPRPNYAKMVEDGEPAWKAAILKAVYDKLSVAPDTQLTPTDADLKAYIETLGQVREALLAELDRVQASGGGAADLWKSLKSSNVFGKVFPVPADAKPLYGAPSAFDRKSEQGKSNNHRALLIGGNGAVQALQFNSRLLSRVKDLLAEGFPAKQEAWQKSYEVRSVEARDSDVPEAERTGQPQQRFLVYEKGSRYRLAKGMPDGGFATREAAEQFARSLTAKKKEVLPPSRGLDLADARRTGPDWRNGRDVTAQDIIDRFGFRGVNLGEYVKAKQHLAQLHLNHVYDAFSDLADLLGVPPKAMSLNGTLGVAVGAQGSGKALAHFVPGVNEINITRDSGAGALSHEFGHGLDHYLATQHGRAASMAKRPYLSAVVGNTKDDGNVRPEVMEAMREVMKTINARPMTEAEVRKYLDDQRTLNQHRMDRWVKEFSSNKGADPAALAAVGEKLKRGDLGEPQDADVETNLAEFMRAAGLKPGNAIAGNAFAVAYRLRDLADEKRFMANHVPQVDTNYAKASAALDAKKQGDGYWSTPWEKFARAFETFAMDALKDRDRESLYLSGLVDSEGWRNWAEATGKSIPYPAGEERLAMQRAFQTLVDTIQTREDSDGNVAMFSRGDGTRIDTSDPKSAADVLLEWGRQAKAQYPTSDATDLAEIARDKGATAAESTITQMDGTEKGTGYWTIHLPAQDAQSTPKPVTLVVEGDKVWINAAGLKEGQGGSRAYDIAAQFALNTGRKFIGDPDGLSDAAMRRRLENMLSSAIKYGTTDHLEPHPRQLIGESKINIPPLNWQNGDTRGNIYSMLRVVDAANRANQGSGSAVNYDAGTGTFRDSEGVPLERVDEALSDLSTLDRGAAGAGSAGRTTLQRAALFAALLRSDSSRRSLLERLRGEQGGGSEGTSRGASELDGALYSRGDQPGGLSQAARAEADAHFKRGQAPPAVGQATLESVTKAVSDRWENSPRVVWVDGLQDPAVPQAVREEDAKQRSNGASGTPEGFYFQGAVYMVRGQIHSISDALRVLFHEALGHGGLRGVFGEELGKVLDTVAAGRSLDMQRKAKEYGFDLNDPAQRRQAAEEVLAEMAQTRPTSTLVQRAIAAIRAFLRKIGVPLELTDNDIISSFLTPAREHIEAGRSSSLFGGAAEGLPLFNRDQSGVKFYDRKPDPGPAAAPETALARKPRTARTSDGYRFTEQPDGTWTDGDQTYDSLDDLFEADRMLRVDGKLYSPKGAAQDQAGGTPMFSRTEAVRDAVMGQRLPAGYLVSDFIKSAGTVSWWDKTVGTMHNLAQKNPLFRPVYDAANRFLNDVSLYATEAANLAPTLLPKLESLRDIGRQPLSAEDTRAIHAPIFEGTLSWTRDEHGQPVEEDDVSKAGIVWTDAELRSKFGLNAKQIGLYREFRKAVDNSLTALALSDMVRFGGNDIGPIRDAVLASSNLGAAARMIQTHLAQLVETSDAARSAVLANMGAAIGKKAAQAQRLIDRGYAPLMRFGHYTLDAVGSDGQRLYFGLFESQSDANKFARELVASNPGARITQGTLSEQAYQMFQGVSPETLELFGGMLGLEAQGSDPASQAFQQYLQLAKSNRSSMKRLIHRKGTTGYSEDAGRVLAGFVYSNARQTSKNIHLGGMTQAVQRIADQKTEGELHDIAVKLHAYVSNPQEEAQAIKGLLFANFLGGSVAAGLVNLTQMPMVSFPYLARFTTVKAAARAMAKAVADAARWEVSKNPTTGDAALDRAIHRAEEEGVISPQEVHGLIAQAGGKSALKAGDGTLAGDLAAKTSNMMSKIMLAWGRPFSLAEQFNRRATFIAAYRVAVAKGMANPSEFAAQAVVDTQFSYTKANRPQWARGAIGSVLFTFKTYAISYVELLSRLARQGPEGRRAALVGLATLVLVSGIDGLPGGGDLDDLIDGLLQHLGYNFSSKRARHEFLAGIVGDGGARFIEKGLSGLPGMPIDVAGRLGLGNLVPGTGLLLKKSDHTQDVAELAGPAGALATNWFKAGNSALQGELGQAGQQVAPTAIANLAKAYDMASTGMYRDQRGRKVLDVDGYDVAAKAIGFQPNDVARVQGAAQQVQSEVDLTRMRETEIADKWARGVFERDSDKVREARAEMAQWNEDNPEAPIRINSAQIVKRVREMNLSREQRIAKTAPKEIRSSVKQQLSEALQ